MINPQLPASTSNLVKAKTRVLVISQLGREVEVADPFSQLKEGAVIRFSSNCSGLVNSVGDKVAAVSLTSDEIVRRGELIKVMEPAVPEFVIKSGVGLGLLSVGCKVPANHEAGLLGWSLYYSSLAGGKGELIISGHDYSLAGNCLYSGEEMWAVGEYQLKITRYSMPSKTAVKTKTVNWKLQENTRELRAGNLNDLTAQPILY